jgi:DNA-binding MarR family transcriptional regulator
MWRYDASAFALRGAGRMTRQNRTFLEIQRAFERRVGLAILTGEYQVVGCLLDSEWVSLLELQQLVHLSPAAVRYTLANMAGRGVILARSNPDDGRSMQHRLTDQMRVFVLEQHAGYRALATAARTNRRRAQVPLNTYHSFIRKGRQVSHLTAEFQILVYLYLVACLGNHEMSQFIDVSAAKFNQSLASLRAFGLIEVVPDPGDRRRKLYNLTQPVRFAMDDLHDEAGRWLDEVLEARASSVLASPSGPSALIPSV